MVAALIGHFQQDGAWAAGQACCATAQWSGQANIVIVLALQPEQGAAAGVFRGADANLAIDLPSVEAADLLFVSFPALCIALAFKGFFGCQARAAGEQGDQPKGDQVTNSLQGVSAPVRRCRVLRRILLSGWAFRASRQTCRASFCLPCAHSTSPK